MSRSTRRELIGAAALGAAALTAPPAFGRRIVSRRAGVGHGKFLDGVASGEPSPTAVTFWSRIRTAHPRSGARLIVARDERLRHVVATRVVPTGSGINGTLKARVGKLKPHTEYFFAWETSDGHSDVGRTRTLPPPGSNQPLSIGFSSCQNYPHGYFSAHSHAATQDLDLYVFLGDYIYAERRTPQPQDPRVDTHNGNDLRSYRAKYQLYRSDVGLRELHRVTPAVHIWDDHEVENNYTDGNPSPSPLQREAGYRAAFEWIPRMVFPHERTRIYRRMPIGQMADLFLLDERQYRTLPTGGQPPQLLGNAQRQWLLAGLAASRAQWKIIANQVVIAPMDYGNGESSDNWSGYDASREQLLSEIEQAGIQNVIFITGDAHVYMVNRLASDPNVYAGDPSHRPAAIEYVGGSVTSPGSDRTEAAVQKRNPWNMQYNGMQHGYAHLALDSTQLVTEYRGSDVTRPDGIVFPFERFTQPSGTNEPQRESIPPPPGLPPPPT